MKFPFNKRDVRIGITAFTVIAASICFYYLVFHGDRFSAQLSALFRIISPVLSGIIFAYLMTPMVNKIEKKFLIPIWSKNKSSSVTPKQQKCESLLGCPHSADCNMADLWFFFHPDTQYFHKYTEYRPTVPGLRGKSDELVCQISRR